MAKVSQSRKWQLTFNNPIENGYPHSRILALLQEFEGLEYACMCDEIGQEGTYHTHVYFKLATCRYFVNIQNKFGGACHIENCRGRSDDNRAYVLKDGDKYNKLADGTYNYIDKDGNIHKGYNISETFEEYGRCPDESQGKARDCDKIVELINAGASTLDIIEKVPSAINNLANIERIRSMNRDEKFVSQWRDVFVTYIYGESGAGKTRSVMDKYGYEAVYRINDYKHPFDGYEGQDVILFDEFRSSINISSMLNYLDGYPLKLPCRYFDRQACYTKVFIISNEPVQSQYCTCSASSRNAFLRRIHCFLKATKDKPFQLGEEFVQNEIPFKY